MLKTSKQALPEVLRRLQQSERPNAQSQDENNRAVANIEVEKSRSNIVEIMRSEKDHDNCASERSQIDAERDEPSKPYRYSRQCVRVPLGRAPHCSVADLGVRFATMSTVLGPSLLQDHPAFPKQVRSVCYEERHKCISGQCGPEACNRTNLQLRHSIG